MAVPSYTEDLTDVNLAETTTGWSAYGGGASGLAQNPDSSMQGTYGVGKQITSADKGQYYDNGSGITLGTGDHVYVWLFCTTPGLTDTRANKGASILVGTSGSAYCQYHVEGNNTYGAAGRVGKCYVVDYTTRSTNGSEPYRTATGSPGANPQVFGGGLVTTASVKGENCVIDAIRYGTGAYLTAGELTSAGDGSDNPCTFAGFNTQNDAVANRWGIFTSVGGSYELQGTFAIGQDNTQTATLCRFQDSDVNIVVADTIHAASTFNRFIIDHASTVCNWTNINITALGTTAPGQITVTSNDPTFNVTGGTWTGLGAITFDSNTTVDGTTIRTCDTVTTGEGTITNCTFDRSTATVACVHNHASVSTRLTDNTFISDGTGHAVNIGTVSSTTSITWDNALSGYVAGSTGSPITTGTSGNEAILCNVAASQTLTINVASGASIPSVKNDGTGSVNVVAGQVTLTIKCVDITDSSNIQNARVYVTAASGGSMTPGDVIIDKVLTDSNGEASDTRSYSGNQPITGRVRKGSASTYYKEAPISGTVNSASGLSLTIQMIPDE